MHLHGVSRFKNYRDVVKTGFIWIFRLCLLWYTSKNTSRFSHHFVVCRILWKPCRHFINRLILVHRFCCCRQIHSEVSNVFHSKAFFIVWIASKKQIYVTNNCRLNSNQSLSASTCYQWNHPTNYQSHHHTSPCVTHPSSSLPPPPPPPLIPHNRVAKQILRKNRCLQHNTPFSNHVRTKARTASCPHNSAADTTPPSWCPPWRSERWLRTVWDRLVRRRWGCRWGCRWGGGWGACGSWAESWGPGHTGICFRRWRLGCSRGWRRMKFWWLLVVLTAATASTTGICTAITLLHILIIIVATAIVTTSQRWTSVAITMPSRRWQWWLIILLPAV